MRTPIIASALVLTLALNPAVASGGDIQTDGKFVSTDPANPPMAVSSTALVPSLNADLVDGFDAIDFVMLDLSGYLPDGVVDDGAIEDTSRRMFLGCNQLEPGYFPDAPGMGHVGLAPALIFGLDATPYEQILLSTLVPDDWDGASGLELRLLSTAYVTEGRVQWGFQITAINQDEDLTTGGLVSTEGSLISFSSSTPKGLVRSTPVTMLADSLEKGDLLSMSIHRLWDFESDTVLGDAYLLGVEITYTAVR